MKIEPDEQLLSDPNVQVSGSRAKRVSVILIACVLAIAAIFSSCLCVGFAMSTWVCGDVLGEEAVSPDGRYRVQVHDRECGAMDSFHTSVEIEDRNHRGRFPFVWRRRHVTILGTNHGLSPYDVRLNWEADRILVISIKRGLSPDVRTRRTKWGDIIIVYRP